MINIHNILHSYERLYAHFNSYLNSYYTFLFFLFSHESDFIKNWYEKS